MAESNNTLERIFYAGGETPKPAPNTNHLRIYGHNLCPYVARARYIFSAKQIEFQECMVDLNNKAKWHLDFNGGLVPVLETPQGDLIPESGILMQYALETNPNGGIQLIPSNPIQAAHMRVKMVQLDKHLGNLFGVVLSRGQDVEKIQKYKDETLPVFEAWCTEANGKFLLGTDDLTMLDIHCAPMFEIMYLLTGSVYGDVDEHLRIQTNAPNWCAYMERFRNHPAIKPYRFNRKANDAHGVRSRAWEQGVKCQLSLDVLEGAWPDEEN